MRCGDQHCNNRAVRTVTLQSPRNRAAGGCPRLKRQPSAVIFRGQPAEEPADVMGRVREASQTRRSCPQVQKSNYGSELERESRWDNHATQFFAAICLVSCVESLVRPLSP